MFLCQVLNKDEQELAAKNEYNFDHPDAFDFELLVSVLRKLKKGKSIKVPVYDFTSHCRRKEWVRIDHTAPFGACRVTVRVVAVYERRSVWSRRSRVDNG